MNSYDVAIYMLDNAVRVATASAGILEEMCVRDLIYVGASQERPKLTKAADDLCVIAEEILDALGPVKNMAEEIKREYQRIQNGLPPKAGETAG